MFTYSNSLLDIENIIISVADSCGEKLAWFFGITTPKYQSAIDEFYRLKAEVIIVFLSLLHSK